MKFNVPFLPASKRFFKISELAGNRWPNITENQIYEWHDANFQLAVTLEIAGNTLKMADTSTGHYWDKAPHFGKVNVLAYWMFFPEFYAFRPNPGPAFRTLFEGDMLSKLPNLQKCQKAFSFDALDRSFLMVGEGCAKGLAFDAQGIVRGLEFYDEKGMLRAPVSFNEGMQTWEIASVEIKKEDLLVSAASVQLLEAIAPEVTSPNYKAEGGGKFNVAMEAAVKPSADSQAELPFKPGDKFLEGWKEIASYLGVSVATAQRHYGPAVRLKDHSRKVITTTASLDEWRLKSATKKIRKKVG